MMGLPQPQEAQITLGSQNPTAGNLQRIKLPKKRSLYQKQTSRCIPLEKKLLLEALTEFGLSDNAAGSLIGLTKCTRLLRVLHQQRKKQQVELASLPDHERQEIYKDQDSSAKQARLHALLIVSKAYDAKQIHKRNFSRIDDQIAESVQAYIKESHPRQETLLHERVAQGSAGISIMRELPLPGQTKWSKSKGLRPCRASQIMNHNELRPGTLNEVERFESLPNDLQISERASLHAALFGSSLATGSAP